MVKQTYGLIGYPLGHSFSRRFFSEKFEAEGIDAQYLNFEIDSIERLPEVLTTEGLRGFNVTIPYKQQIIRYLSEISDEAREIGAVNVVKILPNGKLSGYNTDIIGFTESLRPMLRGTEKRALILGTGGASKAVFVGLKKMGIEPTYVSRSPREGQLSYADLTPELMAEYQVIVNATPLGMWPKTDAAPEIPYVSLTPNHVCFDLVYNPEQTKFMELAAGHGARVKNGLEMLHLQAIAAWKIWNNNK